ncbi:MFS transporter [Amycolatopsis sp. FDAARGOS 1241]|uniref:MFS transporter n=1 Tax=Amycolatopsis sp. FDAARGOS 1241 TaxID=2778070 RepID=UPI001950036E|nr:MFS transporter [Amycolatopsis sp. FDAARGOS 1241]QRP43649.1 MFS transporter [Amycolatopsis sp. FDAARGOS 1241]
MPPSPATASRSLLGRLDESEFTARHLRIYVTVLIGHFLCGFVINLTGVILPGVIKTFHLTSEAAGAFSSALFAGMLVGAAVAGTVSDRFGRKVPLAITVMVYAVFSLAAVFAPSFGTLVTFRALQGIGLGAEIAVVLPYIAEFVPSRHRGPLVTAATAAWLIGLPTAAAVGTAVVPAFGWRAMFVIATVPVVVGVFMLATLPESVRYLLRRGRTQAAEVVVGALCRGTTAPAQHAGPEPLAESGTLRTLVARNYVRYTIAIWFMEVCAGAFLYGLSSWLPSVLEKQGVDLLKSFGYTAIITAAGVVGALLAGQLINRIGRRVVLGGAFVLSGLFCLAWGTTAATAAVVILGSLATFFGSGLAGSTLFAYASELYPTASRATGLGWAAAWQKVGGLIMPVLVGFVLALHASQFLFFLLFGVISILAGIAALVATFETRGRTVEQITREIAGEEAASALTPARS